jgi:hypothetical protein
MWPFDQNKQQVYQQYATHADQGTYGQIPEQEARQNYQQFVQNAPPQMVEQAHAQYYQQMPPEQHASLMQGLLGGLMQRGITPQQAVCWLLAASIGEIHALIVSRLLFFDNQNAQWRADLPCAGYLARPF